MTPDSLPTPDVTKTQVQKDGLLNTRDLGPFTPLVDRCVGDE